MAKLYVERVKTVIFQKAWSNIFERLSDEDAGLLIKALFDFMDGKPTEIEDGRLDGIFLTMADQIETSARNYVRRSGIDD